MKISTKGKYAVQLMVDITLHNAGSCIALKDVSRRQNISVKYLEQVVGALTSGGFLKGARGPQGGYKLMPGMERSTVGDVLRAVEGNLYPVAAPDEMGAQEGNDGQQAVQAMWDGLYRVVTEYLDSITLEDLARESIDGEQDDYSI